MPEDLTTKHQVEVQKEVKKQLKVIQKSREFGSEFKKQAATAMIAAFGFLIALEWRDLITLFVNNFAQTEFIKNEYAAAVYTALIVTAIAVIGIALISRWSKQPDAEKK
ncbi:hypothetical protein CO038_03680 [Candidatus Pacearchaeota archaeon CG_4_9_14_0_2_um_filter_39_13]|nr:MAG: hypothetical protein CO038_03680 [Candidatus Pacearchaeota archaeon CG_4_9_14_0_2_um_filter_39_13]